MHCFVPQKKHLENMLNDYYVKMLPKYVLWIAVLEQ